MKDSQSEISRILRAEGRIQENSNAWAKGVWQGMRAVYLVLIVALVLALGALEVIAERTVSSAYPEAYPESSTDVYFK